jgi:hypothetical protein
MLELLICLAAGVFAVGSAWVYGQDKADRKIYNKHDVKYRDGDNT